MSDGSLNKLAGEPKILIAKRPWGILGSIGFGILAFLLPQAIIAAAAPILLPLLPYSENTQSFALTALVELLAIAIVLGALWLYRSSVSAIGLNRFKLRYIAMAALGFVMYFLLSTSINIIAGLLFKSINFDQQQDVGFASPSGFELILVFIGLVLLPPLAEELLFRGFIYTGFRRHLPFIPTMFLVSVLFASAHGQVNVGLDVFALSLVLCYLREKTNSLWPGVCLHALKNAVAFLVLFVYTGPK